MKKLLREVERRRRKGILHEDDRDPKERRRVDEKIREMQGEDAA